MSHLVICTKLKVTDWTQVTQIFISTYLSVILLLMYSSPLRILDLGLRSWMLQLCSERLGCDVMWYVVQTPLHQQPVLPVSLWSCLMVISVSVSLAYQPSNMWWTRRSLFIHTVYTCRWPTSQCGTLELNKSHRQAMQCAPLLLITFDTFLEVTYTSVKGVIYRNINQEV